jgi:hypothetical protein
MSRGRAIQTWRCQRGRSYNCLSRTGSFEALLDGSLRREDVSARVKHYVAAHNRNFPTRFAKFGNSPLVSLDEVLFDAGATTRGDTVSRGLWG